jgi:hypothetical protein
MQAGEAGLGCYISRENLRENVTNHQIIVHLATVFADAGGRVTESKNFSRLNSC